jgi:CBS domain containing-hemolysin-like protein
MCSSCFPLQGSATVADLRDFYGIQIDAADEATLDQILHAQLGRYPETGDAVVVGPVRLRVREMIGDRIEWVSLCLDRGVSEPEAPTPPGAN